MIISIIIITIIMMMMIMIITVIMIMMFVIIMTMMIKWENFEQLLRLKYLSVAPQPWTWLN